MRQPPTEALDRIEDKQNNVDKNLKEGDEQLSMLERMCCGFGPRAPVRTISVDVRLRLPVSPSLTNVTCLAALQEQEQEEAAGKGRTDEQDPRQRDRQVDVLSPGRGRLARCTFRRPFLHVFNRADLQTAGDRCQLGRCELILGDLKDQANQMSVTVDNQNEQIDRITNATDKNIAHAKQATKRQQAILNNN